MLCPTKNIGNEVPSWFYDMGVPKLLRPLQTKLRWIWPNYGISDPISPLSLYFLPLNPIPMSKLSHFVAKCLIRHLNRECHKNLSYALRENDSESNSLRESSTGLRAESARAVTGRRCPHSGEGEDFLTHRVFSFYENGCNSGTESRKMAPKVEYERSLRGLQTGHWPKLGSYRKNRIFWPKT